MNKLIIPTLVWIENQTPVGGLTVGALAEYLTKKCLVVPQVLGLVFRAVRHCGSPEHCGETRANIR
jgi:hypothetical protein